MVLVYTNSRERAMLLASCIDGVVLKNKKKVRMENYAELCGQMEQELLEDGYLRTFFQGEACTFVYSDGKPCAPNKMVDYDASFADIFKRPVPFIPERLKLHYIDKSFEARLPIYKRMCADATTIINAASDDVEGEIAFSQFSVLFSGTKKQVFRIRPKAMTETAIIETFNALEDTFHREAISEACYLREMLDWLVSCNASNVITQKNYERKFVVAGRLESIVLAQIAERSLTAENYDVRVNVASSEGTIEAFCGCGCSVDKATATKIAEEITTIGSAVVDSVDYKRLSEKSTLLNAFGVQEKGSGEPHRLTPTQVADAMDWLYHKGLITWPTQSAAMPWSMKPQFTNAITALAQNALFSDKVLPRDVDNFLDWEYDQPAFGHTGIIVTEKAIPHDAPKHCIAVYNIIAASNIVAIKMRKQTDLLSATLSCGKYELRIVQRTEGYAAIREEGALTCAPFQYGDELRVTATVRSNQHSVGSISETELLSTMSALLENTFCYSTRTVATALDNLLAWGQIKRVDGHLFATENGLLAYKYLRRTGLTDVTEVLNWDRRLMAIAKGLTDADSFDRDVGAYIDDLCKELSYRAEDIRAFAGQDIFSVQCPVCGASLEFPAEGGCKCENLECGFHIPEEMFGHKMSKLDIGHLLLKKRTGLITDFVSKKGKYAARIVMGKDGALARSFQSLHKCPQCKSPMNEFIWGVRCSSKSCQFVLNTTICGHRLTDKEMHQIVTGNKTDPLRLTNNQGKAFTAQLYLDEACSLKFSFPERKPKS